MYRRSSIASGPTAEWRWGRAGEPKKAPSARPALIKEEDAIQPAEMSTNVTDLKPVSLPMPRLRPDAAWDTPAIIKRGWQDPRWYKGLPNQRPGYQEAIDQDAQGTYRTMLDYLGRMPTVSALNEIWPYASYLATHQGICEHQQRFIAGYFNMMVRTYGRGADQSPIKKAVVPYITLAPPSETSQSVDGNAQISYITVQLPETVASSFA